MSEQAIRRMSADVFLEWCLGREGRYELIDGALVAMTGANRRHDHILVNTLGLLVDRLRGHRGQVFSPDIAVRIPAGNVRRPDAGIDCGPFNETETWAGAPYLVVEVLSPSTRAFDMVDKVEEYKTVPSLRHIVLVDPDMPEARHWSRQDGEPWGFEVLEGLGATIRLPGIPAVLDLAALYEGLTFRPRPYLVQESGGGP